MKTTSITIALLVVLCSISSSQLVKVVVGQKEYTAAPQVGTDSLFYVRIEDREYFLVLRGIMDTLTKTKQMLADSLERYKKVTITNESLLAKYKTFEDKADIHIQKQEKVIALGDSLFHGYKSLYTDLKNILGISNIHIVGGIGIGKWPEKGWQPTFMGGVAVRDWIAQYQFGGGYHGVAVSVRLLALPF